MLLVLILGIGALLAISLQRSSDESSSTVELRKKYTDLIEQLASPNQKPVPSHRGVWGSVKFPKGYDIAAQNRIYDTRQLLLDHFEEALPFLVDALDDDRYCMTIDWAGGWAYYNFSIGNICYDLIDSHLEAYREVMTFYGPECWRLYNYPRFSKDWFKARKGRSLVQLQIEAINWAIERRGAERGDCLDDDRMNEVSDLQKLRDGIARSRRPVRSLGLLHMVTSDKFEGSAHTFDR
jgi:hypothetical protein